MHMEGDLIEVCKNVYERTICFSGEIGNNGAFSLVLFGDTT